MHDEHRVINRATKGVIGMESDLGMDFADGEYPLRFGYFWGRKFSSISLKAMLPFCRGLGGKSVLFRTIDSYADFDDFR